MVAKGGANRFDVANGTPAARAMVCRRCPAEAADDIADSMEK